MSQAYMFQHNVHTARKYAYPFRFQILLHIWTLYIFTFSERVYAHALVRMSGYAPGFPHPHQEPMIYTFSCIFYFI